MKLRLFYATIVFYYTTIVFEVTTIVLEIAIIVIKHATIVVSDSCTNASALIIPTTIVMGGSIKQNETLDLLTTVWCADRFCVIV